MAYYKGMCENCKYSSKSCCSLFGVGVINIINLLVELAMRLVNA